VVKRRGGESRLGVWRGGVDDLLLIWEDLNTVRAFDRTRIGQVELMLRGVWAVGAWVGL